MANGITDDEGDTRAQRFYTSLGSSGSYGHATYQWLWHWTVSSFNVVLMNHQNHRFILVLHVQKCVLATVYLRIQGRMDIYVERS